MQAVLIFSLRVHLESSSQMSKTAGISHIRERRKGERGDEEARTVQFIMESDLLMMTVHTFTESRMWSVDENFINEVWLSSDTEVTQTNSSKNSKTAKLSSVSSRLESSSLNWKTIVYFSLIFVALAHTIYSIINILHHFGTWTLQRNIMRCSSPPVGGDSYLAQWRIRN